MHICMQQTSRLCCSTMYYLAKEDRTSSCAVMYDRPLLYSLHHAGKACCTVTYHIFTTSWDLEVVGYAVESMTGSRMHARKQSNAWQQVHSQAVRCPTFRPSTTPVAMPMRTHSPRKSMWEDATCRCRC